MLLETPSLKVKTACEALDLPRASYYSIKKNPTLSQDEDDLILWEKICEIWEKKFPGIGYKKLARELHESPGKILRILRKFRGKKKQGKARPPRESRNLLKKITKKLVENPSLQERNNWILRLGKNGYRYLIEPTRPYQLWAGDWKELKIPILNTTIYIFIIIDVYTREIVGYNISPIKDVYAALKASRMAYAEHTRDALFKPRKLIVHTDQGGAYIAREYEVFWKGVGAQLSYADKGKPTQNPYSEGFISILSRFWLRQHEFVSTVQVEKSLKKFFKLYNREWLHGEMGYVTPLAKLEDFRKESVENPELMSKLLLLTDQSGYICRLTSS